MRAHPASQDFARRFNLPIYFQLRVQELTKALDAALLPRGTPLPAAAPEPEPEPELGDGQRPLPSPPPPPPLATAAALALVSAVRRCFSPSVLLTPLSARFLRLALQTVARFSEWLLTLTPPATDAAASSTATPTASAAAATPSSSAAAADGAAAAEQGTVLSLYTPLHFDLGAVVGWLTTLAPQLPALLQLPASGPAASLGAECSAALAEATGAITTADLALRSAMIAQQAEQCAAHLATGAPAGRKAPSWERCRGSQGPASGRPTGSESVSSSTSHCAGVRAIAASYRMTGKAAPTAPSFFLPEVIRSLSLTLAPPPLCLR